MSEQNDKIKDRIRKLLTLANDSGAFEGEIDNALRFARRLMLQHNVSEADLGKPQDPHEAAAAAEYAQHQTYTMGASLSTWEIILMNAIADLIGSVNHYRDSGVALRRTAAGTVEYDSRGQARKGSKVVFYGPAEDARDAGSMFDEWSHVIASMARLKFGGCFRGDGKAYAEGFAQGLKSNVVRIRQEERKEIAAAPATGGALVLVRATDVMAAKKEFAVGWLKKEHGIRLKTGSSRRSVSAGNGAYGAGLSDGRQAGFSRSRTLRIGR